LAICQPERKIVHESEFKIVHGNHNLNK